MRLTGVPGDALTVLLGAAAPARSWLCRASKAAAGTIAAGTGEAYDVVVARDPGGGQFAIGGRTPPIEVTVLAPDTHDISSALWTRLVLSARSAGSRLRPSPAAIAHACAGSPMAFRHVSCSLEGGGS